MNQTNILTEFKSILETYSSAHADYCTISDTKREYLIDGSTLSDHDLFVIRAVAFYKGGIDSLFPTLFTSSVLEKNGLYKLTISSRGEEGFNKIIYVKYKTTKD